MNKRIQAIALLLVTMALFKVTPIIAESEEQTVGNGNETVENNETETSGIVEEETVEIDAEVNEETEAEAEETTDVNAEVEEEPETEAEETADVSAEVEEEPETEAEETTDVNAEVEENPVTETEIATASELNGWVTEDGFVYYYSYGYMYKDTSCEIYDPNTDTYNYYRFDSNGHMVTGWYEEKYDSSYSAYYYYGTDGKAATDLTQISGEYYYFYGDGQMATSGTYVSNGYLCVVSENGKSTVAQMKKGWIKLGEDYYYSEDGEQYVSNDWVKLGDYYYYFDYSGVMLHDTTRWIYDESDAQYVYCFDSNGHMVTGWYEEKYDYGYTAYYYCGTDGKAATGLTQISGEYYCFNEGGQMVTYGAYVSNGYLCVPSENGKCAVTQMKKGWIKLGEDYYYSEDGEQYVSNDWVKLGDYYYYFDYSGVMAHDTELWICDESDGQYYYYRFDSNGHMVTGWYEEKYNSGYTAYYYYGTDGKAATGLTQISGEYYCFNEVGQMVTYGTYVSNGYLYVPSQNGTCTVAQMKKGWIKLGGDYYYSEDGEQCVSNDWVKSGDYYYYFNDSGVMVHDTELWICDESDGQYYTYRFDSNGHIITGWYSTIYKDWYYYGTDGKGAKGVTSINGKKYVFGENGAPIDYSSMVESNILYRTGKYGEVLEQIDASNKGWKLNNGYYFYSDGKKYYVEEEATISGKTYKFDFGGRMYSREYILTYNNDEQGHSYIAKYYGESGALVKNSWVETSVGEYMYAGNDGICLKGWQKIGNTWYYFSEDYYPVMQTGCITIDGVEHLFAENGSWIGKLSAPNGWNLISGQYYYVENNNMLKSAWKSVNGNWYYLGYDGVMLKDTITTIDGNKYAFDTNGIMVTDKWYNVCDTYVKASSSGKLLIGWQKIGDTWYYFDSNGWMENHNFSDRTKVYIINSDGKYQGSYTLADRNGWVEIGYNFYYYENGNPVKGWKKINNKWYYFSTNDGTMYCDSVYEIDQKSYFFDKDGVWSGKITGWVKTNNYNYGEYYYLKDGQAQVGWFNDGKNWYYLRPGMLRGGVYKIEGQYYSFDDSGKYIGKCSIKDGWQKINNKWYYGKNGELLSGIQKINGKEYIFGTYIFGYYCEYQMQENTVVYAASCIVGSDGSVLKNQWFKYNNKWYYANSLGLIYTNGTYQIDGKNYKFNRDGELI